MGTKLNKGQAVKIRSYPDKIIERVVLEEFDTYVLCCRREVYGDNAINGQDYSKCMGFPKEDVLEVIRC